MHKPWIVCQKEEYSLGVVNRVIVDDDFHAILLGKSDEETRLFKATREQFVINTQIVI